MLHVTVTDHGVTKYPRHKHEYPEIMLYLEGEGYMYCQSGSIPFLPGTVIIMPTGILHGSVSEHGFKNISVGGDLETIFMLTKPTVLHDNELREAKKLALLLLETRSNDSYYRKSLLEAYTLCLLQMLKTTSQAFAAVELITSKIREQAFDSEISLSSILRESGYAEDYIRDRFKALVGTHPSAFLTKIRMERAQYLMDIYGSTQPLSKIAESCGYTDYIYFSKKFKEQFWHFSAAIYEKMTDDEPPSVKKDIFAVSC